MGGIHTVTQHAACCCAPTLQVHGPLNKTSLSTSMQLTVAAWDDRVFPVELDDNESLSTLQAILEAGE